MKQFRLLAFLASSALCLRMSETFKPFGPNVEVEFDQYEERNSVSPKSFDNAVNIALEHVNQKLNTLNIPNEYRVTDSYETKHNGVTHVYLQQLLDGLEVFNAFINVNVDRNGNVLSMGSSFHAPKKYTKAQYSTFSGISDKNLPPFLLEADEALKSLFTHLELKTEEQFATMRLDNTYNVQLMNVFHAKDGEVSGKLGYINNGEDVELVWSFEIDFVDRDHWLHSAVSAITGEVLAINDWIADSGYLVYDLPINDPSEGRRSFAYNPEDPVASPLGWHNDGKTKYTNTMGNNVFAQDNVNGGSEWRNNHRPSSANLTFAYPIDFSEYPETYIDASITNLFYWNNLIHDIFYQYGFDEVSGNFQQTNFDKGGKGDDAVIANSQDGQGMNNANFATPPDGRNGRMRMYAWVGSPVDRDGDLESGIIIHEYGHGISTRLTGGPANSGCLGYGEAGGMGEGWSDAFATMFRQRPEYTRNDSFGMGSYASSLPKGIRKFLYSTDMTINPEHYGYIRRSGYFGVHAIGEVWAGMLYEVYWNFVDAHGFSEDWYNGTAGNNILLQDIIDGMKLQPCMPTFVSARDAILQADQLNYNGANECLIWKGFAKRGLGTKAKKGGKEDFTLPTKCE